MRFLMLTTFYPPWSFGGDAVLVQQLAHALAERGHDVTVGHSVASHRLLAGRSSPRLEDVVRSEGPVRLVALDAGSTAAAPLASYLTGRPALLRRRLERLLGEGFDVVHLHNPSLLGAPGLFRLGTQLKLMTLHDYWLVCPMHVLTRNRRERCEERTCIRCALVHRRPPQPWRYTNLLPRSLRGIDALLAPSGASAEQHRGLREHVRIESLPNFVRPDPGVRESGNAVKPYFLFAGRLEPMKGVERLIAAFARRGGQEELVIAGGGSLERELRRRVARLPHVHLVGHLDKDALDVLYRGALAVVIPTIGHESCPLVLLEAQARGIPVICSDHGALRELAGVGGGLLFAHERGLDEALARIAADAELRGRLGRRGRAGFLAEWTEERHLTRYFGLIAELAERRGDQRLRASARAAA